MNIDYLKNEIYFEDEGTLRDIYILNTAKEDWQKWAEIVNTNFNVEFYNGQTGQTENKIDIAAVINFWEGNSDKGCKATIKLDGIDINCHFFAQQEIENDFDPIQITTIEDHEKVMNYLQIISEVLNKKVILTPENKRNFVLVDYEINKINN